MLWSMDDFVIRDGSGERSWRSGGQVYVLYNRVDSIRPGRQSDIERLVPEASVASGTWQDA